MILFPHQATKPVGSQELELGDDLLLIPFPTPNSLLLTPS
jgi:hypothetical protein